MLASGPSLTQAQVNYCRGKARVLVINTTWERAPWADVLYACDAKWWHQYIGTLKFEGLRYTQDDSARMYSSVRHIESVDEPGLSLMRARIHQGANSGHQAINLAVHFGAKRIILLGYDMKSGPGGELHHHPDHPASMNNPNPANYKRWIKNFATMEPDLNRAGVEVINCSPGSAIECFPRARLEDVL